MQIRLSDVSNSPDGKVSINVALNANKNPVSIISLELKFEPNLLTNPEAIINPTIKQGTPTDRMLSTRIPSVGILKLDFSPASQTQASLNAVIPDGIIATVTFDVAPAAKSGVKVNLTNTFDALDSKKRFFKTTVQNTTIIIEPAQDVLRQEIAKILEDFARVDWNSRRSMYYENLSDKSWKLRLKSEKALINLGKPAVPILVEKLSSENPHSRALISLVLGVIGDKAAVSPLIARLQDDDETVRLYAAEALGRLEDSSAQGALEEALRDKSSHVANYAQIALKRLKGEVSMTEESGTFVMASESLQEKFRNTLDESAWDKAQLNKIAPDFRLLDSDGNWVSLEDYKDKKRVVLVFLLADW